MEISNGMNKSKVLGLVLILLILAAGVYYFYFLKPEPATPEPPKSILSETQYFQVGELPKGFPSDLPLEESAQILENFTAKFATKENNVRLQDGTLATAPEFYQSTYSYVSEKSLSENNEIYKKYFTGKKYKLLTESISENSALLSYSITNQNNETFQFSASFDPISQKTRVTLDKVFPIFSFENGSVIAN